MKRPTQADVARLAGVSRATVSYVVNGLDDGRISIARETRERVLAAIKTLGYQPDARARSLRSGVTNTLGLLIPDMHNPHFWQIADGVEQAAQEAGYDLLLASTSLNVEREQHSLQALLRRRIDGLILVLTYADRLDETLTLLATQRYPVVVLNSTAVLQSTDVVGIDVVDSGYREGAAHVMLHLLGLGHQEIGLIYGFVRPEFDLERLIAYKEALHVAGLAVDESLIDRCGATIEDGYRAAMRMLDRKPRPTAIVTINDLLAIGAFRAAYDCGLRVPDDISVASFDDIRMAAYLSPPLTTVRANAEEMGRASVKLLLDRQQQPDLPAQHVRIPSALMIRKSTGPTRCIGGR